ncbi:MAG TPA: tripartite tricarboxylate transporter substrate-binding protein [Rariglobus sp.]
MALKTRRPQLKALGVTSKTRWSAMPDVPSLAESGVTDYEIDLWYAVMAPAKTPRSVVDKLNKEINTYLRDPATKVRFDAQALTPTPTTPDAVNDIIRKDVKRWREIAKQINLQLN